MSNKYNIHYKHTIEESFEAIMRTESLLLKKYEPVALLGLDSEGVHQMRVSLRKMRSLLSTFRLIFPKKAISFISDELRYASLELDRARDLDVYIQTHFFHDKDRKKLMYKLAKKEKKRAYKKVKKLIKSKRYKNFHKLLNSWLRNKEWNRYLNKKQQKAFKKSIKPFAIEVIESYQNKIITAGVKIETLDDEALHKLRIECKKLRYVTEFFSSLFSENMKLFTNTLKELQDILGFLHDRSVMKKLHKRILKGEKNIKLQELATQLEMQEQEKIELMKKRAHQQFKEFIEIKEPWL